MYDAIISIGWVIVCMQINHVCGADDLKAAHRTEEPVWQRAHAQQPLQIQRPHVARARERRRCERAEVGVALQINLGGLRRKPDGCDDELLVRAVDEVLAVPGGHLHAHDGAARVVDGACAAVAHARRATRVRGGACEGVYAVGPPQGRTYARNRAGIARTRDAGCTTPTHTPTHTHTHTQCIIRCVSPSVFPTFFCDL